MGAAYAIERIALHRDELESIVLPKLRGTVFHVTSQVGFEGIQATDSVYANGDGRFPFTFPQSENGFGRRRGYVCLFDLREVTDEQLTHALEGYYFLDPFGKKQNPIFLFLSPDSYDQVIHWSATKGDYTEMWVPYVEAWYPRDLPLSIIVKVLALDVEHPAPSFLELALDASWKPQE